VSKEVPKSAGMPSSRNARKGGWLAPPAGIVKINIDVALAN
jgi:hypothetical protein